MKKLTIDTADGKLTINTAHAKAKASYAVELLSEISLTQEDFARVALLLLDQACLSARQQNEILKIVRESFEGLSI